MSPDKNLGPRSGVQTGGNTSHPSGWLLPEKKKTPRNKFGKHVEKPEPLYKTKFGRRGFHFIKQKFLSTQKWRNCFVPTCHLHSLSTLSCSQVRFCLYHLFHLQLLLWCFCIWLFSPLLTFSSLPKHTQHLTHRPFHELTKFASINKQFEMKLGGCDCLSPSPPMVSGTFLSFLLLLLSKLQASHSYWSGGIEWKMFLGSQS